MYHSPRPRHPCLSLPRSSSSRSRSCRWRIVPEPFVELVSCIHFELLVRRRDGRRRPRQIEHRYQRAACRRSLGAGGAGRSWSGLRGRWTRWYLRIIILDKLENCHPILLCSSRVESENEGRWELVKRRGSQQGSSSSAKGGSSLVWYSFLNGLTRRLWADPAARLHSNTRPCTLIPSPSLRR